MKFNLCGYEIDINDGLINYNNLKKEIYTIDNKVASEFEAKFYKKFANMDEVIGGIREFAYGYVYEAVELGIQILNKNGIHTYNPSRFIDEFHFQITNRLDHMIEIVEDEYLEIIEDQAAAAEYRQARKDSRGRWQGGGFGIEGAVKGAVTAGAANMASGAAHSLVNAIGNAGSSIAANQKKKKMYARDSYNYLTYMSGIGSAIEGVLDGVATVLDKNTDISVDIPQKDSDSMNSYKSIIENIKKKYITGHDAIMIECCNIIMDNPYYLDAYDQIMRLCADPKHEIEDMTNYFGMTEITNFKKKRIREQLEKLNYYDVKELQTGVESVYEWMERFGVEKLPYVESIDNVVAWHDEKARTTDEQEYDSKEEATKALANIKQYIEKINATSGNDVEAINILIADIKKSSIKSKDKYIKYLEDKLVEEDGRFRKVKGKIYDSRETAEIARKEAIEIDSILQDITTIEVLKSVRERIEKLQSNDLKDKYLAYLALFDSIIEAQSVSEYEKKIAECSTRKDLSIVYETALLLVKKAKKLGCNNSEFVAWFDEWTNKYLSVNGKVCATPSAADKAYYTWIKHTNQYLGYVNEKNNSKKSLWGSLKNVATGLVFANYESEYNALTENGTKEIPNEPETELEGVEIARETSVKLWREFEAKTDKIKSPIAISTEIEESSLNVDNLLKATPKMDAGTINRIMSQSCEGFRVVSTPTASKPSSNSVGTKNDSEKKHTWAESHYITFASFGDKEKTLDVLCKNLSIDRSEAEKIYDRVPVELGAQQGITGDALDDMAIQLLSLGAKLDDE